MERVEKAPGADWRVFVHFTDADGNIKFQNDHEPAPPTSRWPVGGVGQGPFSIAVPEGLAGTFDVRMGLFQPATGQRASLAGARDGERSQLVGKLNVNAEKIEFEPAAKAAARTGGDVAVFTRADGGWAEGLHLVDRFVKNTYEILSPLNEITSQAPMTRHQFLTPDRKVQRTVFGEARRRWKFWSTQVRRHIGIRPRREAKWCCRLMVFLSSRRGSWRSTH